MENEHSLQQMPHGIGTSLAAYPFLVVFAVFCYLHAPVEVAMLHIQDDDIDKTFNFTYFTYVMCILTAGIIMLFGSELIFRSTLVVQEMNHFKRKYDCNSYKMLKSIFSLEYPVNTLGFVTISVGYHFMAAYAWPEIYKMFIDMQTSTMACMLLLCSIIRCTMGLRVSSSYLLIYLKKKNLPARSFLKHKYCLFFYIVG